MTRGRRALRVLVIVSVLLVGLLVVGALLTQTAWFRERLRRFAVRQAATALEGRLEIGSIEGDLVHGVTLRDVAVVQDDVRVVSVGRVDVAYGVGSLLSDGRTVRQITIDRPVIDAVRTPNGWNVASLLKPRPPADPNKPRATFTLPEIRVTNAVVNVREVGVPQTQAIPRRIEGLTFEGSIASSPHEFSADIRKLTFRAGQPDLDLRSLAGRIVSIPHGWRFQSLNARTAESVMTVDGTLTRPAAASPWAFDLNVTGQPVSLPEISRFIPATAFALHPHLAVGVTGTVEALKLKVDITQSEAGRVKGDLSLDTTAPSRGVTGRLAVADVNLAPIVKDPAAAGRITGDTTFDLRFPSATAGFPIDGTFTFVGPRASGYGYEATSIKASGALDGRNINLDASADAYGGRATTKGTIARAGQGQRELALDLTGRVSGVDLRNLPAALRIPRLQADLTGTYTVRGALSSLDADAVLGPSTLEGATLADGTVGSFKRTPRGFTFGAAGTVAGLDLQRLGAALEVPALTDPKLAGVVNGTFAVSGEQRGREGLRVEARSTLTDSRVYQGDIPHMDVTATLDGNRLDVQAKGRAEDFELETVSGTPSATGILRGDVDVRVALPDVRSVALDTMGVEGTVTLENPTLINVPFTSVTGDITLANGLLTVRRLDGTGDGFTLTGSGAVGLGPDDASDFRYRLEAESLVNPAKVANLPLTGSATTEGRITGSRADFLVTGTLAGDQVAYSDTVAAGTVTAQYAVRLPDFDPRRVDVQTSIDAQQIQVAGQVLATMNGTAGYTTDLVRFDASATDALRTIAARGTMRLEEGRQQLALDRAQVSREGVQWALAPDTTAGLTITPRQVTIGQLHLTNGTQRLDLEGAVGLTTDAESSLRVVAAAVDISDVLTLTGQTFKADGVLTASATLGGTRERPLADATLEVTQGRLSNIDVQRLGGRVTFDGTLGLIDLELVKDQNARLTAKGVLPRTLLEGRSAEHVAATAADRLDVAIVSTPIDLALAEGVSEYVSKLGGQAQVDVRVTGSGRDPHVEGAVFVTDGTFVVPMTGVTYGNLDAVLTFEEERLVISELGVETGSGDLLTVQGELGLSRQQARTVSLKVTGKDVKVVDNHYGSLDLDADLTISGTVLAPVIEGSLQVSDGRLELDEIVPQVANTNYATRAEYQGIPTDRLRGAIVPDLLGGADRAPELVPGTNTFTVGTVPVAGVPPSGDNPDAPPSSPLGDPATGTAGPRPAGTPAATSSPSPAQPPAAGAAAGASADAAAASEGVFSQTALNVQVRIPDNLIVRGQSIEAARISVGDLNATLGGDFRIAKTTGKPLVLLGTVNTVRGIYSYQGRRFDLLRDGQILFRGAEEIDPRLDITAERQIQGVEARVRIQGTARHPTLSLSSNPPLDEGDVLALIVFNQPINQLATGQQSSLAEKAGGIAAGFVVSPLAEALGSTLDLDQFEVETTDPSGRVNPAVVIGQQVTQDMFLRFRQQFGDQQVSQFLLEYRLADFVRLQGNVAEGDGLSAGNRSLTQRIERYGMDLVFFFSF
jgi:autotransporter translocation and assembly factor TamB